MELWVALALGSAFLQNLRSALQRSLTARLGLTGATYARFVFAAPLAVLLALALAVGRGDALPGVTPVFVVAALSGALGQIGGTLMLLRLFSLRNFAVGNTFAKTETVQAALFGAVLLGDRIGALPLAGIVVSLGGIVLLSAGGWRRGGDGSAALGLACGAAFAISGVAYRAASLGLAGEAGYFTRAALTLAVATVAQTLVLGLWMGVRAPGTVGAVLRAWRAAAPVGAAGMLASLGWFTAFTLASAAEVKAVGQVELVFSWLTARFAFGERPGARETLGIALVAGGIVLLVLTS
jgi:drug/metabolite transporter (DMT)-like permease